MHLDPELTLLLRALVLPLLHTTHLPPSNAKNLAAFMGEHVFAAFAHHAEARAPSRNSFHAGVPRKAEKCAVVGLQLHQAAASTRHNLKQAVPRRAFGIRLD